MTDSEVAARYLVSGRVQGVFFRASTQDHARMLGLRGWVRNLRDGRVEVLAVGPASALDALHTWLHQGPSTAVVDHVERLPAEPDEPLAGFEVVR